MNLTQNVTVSGGLSALSTVWRYPGANYTRYGGGGLSFGPVGLKGTSSGGGSGQWVLAELLDLVSGERRACLAGPAAGYQTQAQHAPVVKFGRFWVEFNATEGKMPS